MPGRPALQLSAASGSLQEERSRRVWVRVSPGPADGSAWPDGGGGPRRPPSAPSLRLPLPPVPTGHWVPCMSTRAQQAPAPHGRAHAPVPRMERERVAWKSVKSLLRRGGPIGQGQGGDEPGIRGWAQVTHHFWSLIQHGTPARWLLRLRPALLCRVKVLVRAECWWAGGTGWGWWEHPTLKLHHSVLQLPAQKGPPPSQESRP